MVAMPRIETKNKNKKQQPTSWIAASSRKKGKNKTNNETIAQADFRAVMPCQTFFTVFTILALPGIIGPTTLLQ